MRIWRIARTVYDPLSGEGARLHGGRWNPVGLPVVYASAHLSLSVLELLVHVDPEDLPDDAPACQEIGRRWVEAGSSPVLRVPSAVVPQEANYLVSPVHPEAERIREVGRAPFRFDPRLPGVREA